MMCAWVQEPIDLLGCSQEDDSAAAAALAQEPEKAPGRTFECAICYDEHSLEDCYIASMCGHRMCRDAARQIVLGAVQ